MIYAFHDIVLFQYLFANRNSKSSIQIYDLFNLIKQINWNCRIEYQNWNISLKLSNSNNQIELLNWIN